MVTGPEINVETPLPGVVVIRMHAIARRNALTGPFARHLAGAVREVSADPRVGALVLTGGTTAFCGGAHRDVLAAASRQEPEALADLKDIYDTFDAVRHSPCITIASVCGPAVGAGLNLALACDVRVVARDAHLQSMFIHNQMHPGGGHLRMLLDVAGPEMAVLMAALDVPVSGADAVSTGLAHVAVDADMTESHALSIARRAGQAPALVRQVKDSIQVSAALDVASAARREGELQMQSLRARSRPAGKESETVRQEPGATRTLPTQF